VSSQAPPLPMEVVSARPRRACSQPKVQGEKKQAFTCHNSEFLVISQLILNFKKFPNHPENLGFLKF
jgi:hypothetical protein